jgi:hypothetical protein
MSELWDSRRPVRTWTRKLRKLRSGSRYQASTGEDTADLRAVVNCRAWELEISLWLAVVTICKCSINPVYRSKPLWTSQDAIIICHHLHCSCNSADVRVDSESFARNCTDVQALIINIGTMKCVQKRRGLSRVFVSKEMLNFAAKDVMDFMGLGISAEKPTRKMKCKFSWKCINKICLDVVSHKS